MLAAGFDVPYVQDQVGHSHPATTLAVYAKGIRRPDRDAVRAEMRELFGEERAGAQPPAQLRISRGGGGRACELGELGGLER